MTTETTVERDPRHDPQPLDKIRKKGVVREVVWVGPTGEVAYEDTKRSTGQQFCEIETWRKWAKGAIVDHHGGLCEGHMGEEKIKVDRMLASQINRLAFRFGNKERVSTPYHDTMVALLELAVADLVRSPSRERVLQRVLSKRVLPKARPE